MTQRWITLALTPLHTSFDFWQAITLSTEYSRPPSNCFFFFLLGTQKSAEDSVFNAQKNSALCTLLLQAAAILENYSSYRLLHICFMKVRQITPPTGVHNFLPWSISISPSFDSPCFKHSCKQAVLCYFALPTSLKYSKSLC